MSRILVAGAGGAIGAAVVERLRAHGADVVATYRTSRKGVEDRLRNLGASVRQWDIADTKSGAEILSDVDGAVFIPILSVSKQAAALLPAAARAVFFSSNNVSVDPKASVYNELLTAERHVMTEAPGAVILRPTMIYGHPGDGNLSALMQAMRRMPFAPLMGAGTARQQPVFFRDVAAVAADFALGRQGRTGCVAVAGPEPMSQRSLYDAVKRASGSKCTIINMPLTPIAFLARAVEATGFNPPLSSAQIARANLDKTPGGDQPILTGTALSEGLAALVEALDAAAPGA